MSNYFTIIGRIVKDADTGLTAKGKPVAKFTLVWNYGRKTKSGNDPKSNFFPVELYGNENVYDYLKAGKTVSVTGRVQTGSYKNKDGKTQYTKVLIADPKGFQLIEDGGSAGMSTAVIRGNIAADATTTYIQDSQTAIVEFRVFVNKSWDKENPDIIPVKMYGKRGEALARYLTKGKGVVIKGRVDTGSYKRSDGTTVYTWDVIPSADEDAISFLKGKKPEAVAAADEAPAPKAAPEPEEDDFESTGFVALPDEFDEEYFDEF
jgi:single-stranded DNA-binding protein